MTDFEERSPQPEPFGESPAPAIVQATDDDLSAAQNVAFENMTLAQAIGAFVSAPSDTWRRFMDVARVSYPPTPAAAPLPRSFQPAPAARQAVLDAPAEIAPQTVEGRQREAVVLGVRLCALLIAWWGSGIMATQRREDQGLAIGLPILLVAFMVWFLTDAFAEKWPQRFIGWWQTRTSRERPTQPEMNLYEDSPFDLSLTNALQRGVLLLGGAILSALALNWNMNNSFTTQGFWAWMGSIVLWVAALAPSEWGIRPAIQAVRAQCANFHIRGNWTLAALVLIMLLGALFRLSDLSGTPPEMTSDHVEKLLDAQRVLDGTHQIFFPNNGGREPFQMYTMALFSQLPGLGMNFTTLKLLSALEGIITLPILWWMGREIIGKDEPLLGNLVGLALAALVAASYWHTALSRLALRIVLTPLVTALLVIFLSRALRDNRRGDFIKAGLVLGLGLYMYQAVRMLPVVVLIGIGLALLFKARSLRTAQLYVWHLAVLVIIAGVVFVPMLGFAQQYPDDFWRRTSGRLLGDDLIQTTDEAGNVIEREPTPAERMAALRENLNILTNNIRNALLMYNWKGDVAWINGAPNRPAMDTITASLLIVGLAAWLARMVRRRDPANWLMPVALFIMLLPSALSIAYPVENPSATRTSGTLPEAYLFAALPLALIIYSAIRLSPDWRGATFAAAGAAVVTLLAFGANSSLYFGMEGEEYRISYRTSSLPYSEVGRRLRGFAESDGSFGNAFMVAYPYWWDHRAIGIEAGHMDWPNGIVKRENIISFLNDASQREDEYRFDPEKDMLFFVSPNDIETQDLLQEYFPDGYAQLIQSYHPEDTYVMFRVPRLGREAFVRFMESALTAEG
jgi:hypothetical protein